MTKYGLTLSNRGVVTGATRFGDMMALARAADAEPLWDSLWVGDSIIAKPRLDAISLLGAFAAEFAALGIEPGSRMRRMEEAVEIMRLTSSQENASYHGEYNHFDNVTIEPRSVQQPLPIWITSNPRPDAKALRERGLRRVARLGDGWMTTFQSPDIVREYMTDIRR